MIEIKGDQFFNEEGVLYNPFNRALDGLFAAKQAFMKSQNILIWSNKEIQPILDYINEKYTKDYLNLFRKDLPFPYPSLLKGDYNAIRFFHKSIFEASYKKRKSPLQAWNDKEYVRKSALNRLRYVHRCRPEDILKGFSLTQLAPKVSVFKPSTAETLIKKYLNNFNEVFDPFSGFSGRMIGAARCNKIYNGQDMNEKHVKESNEIIEYLKLKNCSVTQHDILNDVDQVHELIPLEPLNKEDISARREFKTKLQDNTDHLSVIFGANFLYNIYTVYLISHFRKASSCNEPYITSSNNSQIHNRYFLYFNYK